MLMKTLSSKKIRQMTSDLQAIEMALSEIVTADKFEHYSNIAINLALEIELIQECDHLSEKVKAIQDKGQTDTRKGHHLRKMYSLLAPKVGYLIQKAEQENPPIKDGLFYSYEDKGFRNASIERLEALKLQLELSVQKGFYLMQTSKTKVKAQEDILVIAAQIIQEISYETDLVRQIVLRFQGLRECENLSCVTDKEEAVIAECYVLLLESLLNLNYR